MTGWGEEGSYFREKLRNKDFLLLKTTEASESFLLCFIASTILTTNTQGSDRELKWTQLQKFVLNWMLTVLTEHYYLPPYALFQKFQFNSLQF